ncbi:MAG: hypothetical protein KGQ51_12135 [Planctomycetes bacterium]|nr:hypothetical protein [Planctomycetota bacterium]
MIDFSLTYTVAILRLDGYDNFYIPRWMILASVLTLLASITIWRLTLLTIRWWNRPCKSPHKLFRVLCDRHQLNASERSMLQKMASEGPYDPNYLFIDPDLWKAKSKGAEVEPQRQELFRKLFGQLPVAG